MPAWLCACGRWAVAWAAAPSVTCPGCGRTSWQAASPAMGGPTLARLADLMADQVRRDTCVATQLSDGAEAPATQAVRSPQQAPANGRVQMRVGYGIAPPRPTQAPGRGAPGSAPAAPTPVTPTSQEVADLLEYADRIQAESEASRRITPEQVARPIAAPPPPAGGLARPTGRPLTNQERGLAIRQVWADAFPGRVNDGKRGCSVCGADETMVCDRTAHRQAEERALATNQAPPTDDAAARYDKLELDGGPTKH